jgi:hypothetical protein
LDGFILLLEVGWRWGGGGLRDRESRRFCLLLGCTVFIFLLIGWEILVESKCSLPISMLFYVGIFCSNGIEKRCWIWWSLYDEMN